jgi:hypothetical protein
MIQRKELKERRKEELSLEDIYNTILKWAELRDYITI